MREPSTFRPQLLCEPLERRILFADGFLDVTIGDGAAKSVRFVDVDGTAASVAIRGGTAIVRLAGDGLTQVTNRRDVIVNGTGVAVAAVTATGTSRRTSISFTGTGGDDRMTVGQIDTDGPLSRIDGREVVLTGSLTTGGPVRRVELFGTRNAAITLGAGAGTSSVTIREDAIDTDLTSAAPLRRVDLFRWFGLDLGDTITAPSIGRVNAEVFNGDMNAGSVGVLDLNGIENTIISLTGTLGRISGVTATNTLVRVAGDIGSISFGRLGRCVFYAGVRPLPGDAAVPTTVTDFDSPSTIKRFRLDDVYVSSAIVAAQTIDAVMLSGVRLNSPSTDVIVAADRIRRTTAWSRNDFGDRLKTQRISTLDNEVRKIGTAELRAL